MKSQLHSLFSPDLRSLKCNIHNGHRAALLHKEFPLDLPSFNVAVFKLSTISFRLISPDGV